MEKKSGAFVGSKEGGRGGSKEYRNVVGLGLRMQEANESCTTHHHDKRVMMLMSQSQSQSHHYHRELFHHYHFSSSSNASCSNNGDDADNTTTAASVFGGLGLGGCGGGGGDGGPMFCTTSNHPVPVACLGDIYDVVRTVSASASASASGSSDAAGVALPLPVSMSDFSPLAFTPSGEMTPSINVKVPFTVAQWQELERQTMIYKYMMASFPVPPELLMPITNKSQSNAISSQSNMVRTGSLELGISSHNTDPEPWRCKRTDGKKWRCSRDVAPDQKYCERHSHKSRLRSTKPVELHTTATTDSIITNNSNYNTTDSYLLNQRYSHFPSSQTNCNLSMFPRTMASYDHSRSLEWFLKGETVPVASNSNEEWQNLKRDGIRSYDKAYNIQHHYKDDQINPSKSHMNFRNGRSLQAQRLNDQCSLLFPPKSASMESVQETRHFIDAWSNAVRDNNVVAMGNEGSVSSGEKLLPLSSLTLSMSGTGSEETNEEHENAQLGGFGVIGYDRDNQSGGALRPTWMTQGSWMGSPPGGPLAEALCLGISTSSSSTASNLASPHGSCHGYGTNSSNN